MLAEKAPRNRRVVRTTQQPLSIEAQYVQEKHNAEQLRDALRIKELALLQSLIQPGQVVPPVLDANGFEF